MTVRNPFPAHLVRPPREGVGYLPPMETVTLLVPHQQGLPHTWAPLPAGTCPSAGQGPCLQCGLDKAAGEPWAAPTLAKVGLPGTGSSKQAILSTHMCAPEYSLPHPSSQIPLFKGKDLAFMFVYLPSMFVS